MPTTSDEVCIEGEGVVIIITLGGSLVAVDCGEGKGEDVARRSISEDTSEVVRMSISEVTGGGNEKVLDSKLKVALEVGTRISREMVSWPAKW